MLVIKAKLKSHIFSNYYGLFKAEEECPTTKWPLPGNKFRFAMRMKNNPNIKFMPEAQLIKSRQVGLGIFRVGPKSVE